MLIFLRILGIVLIVLSVFLLIALPPAGIIGIIIGVFCLIRSSWNLAEKINNSLSKSIEKNKQNSEKWKKRSEELAAEYEKIKLESNPGKNIVFIEYEDSKGDYSDRTINIRRVYRRSKKLYINADCYMAGEERTFLVERIITMKDRQGGQEIKDIEGYLNDNFLNKLSKKNHRLKIWQLRQQNRISRHFELQYI